MQNTKRKMQNEPETCNLQSSLCDGAERHTVIAVDPGKDKCGVVVVTKGGEILYRGVVRREEVTNLISSLSHQFKTSTVVLGDRTGAKELAAQISQTSPQVKIVFIDEHLSTEQAKRRFFQENPPKGLRKLIPISWQLPPRPFDDYVAVILAEKFFKKT